MQNFIRRCKAILSGTPDGEVLSQRDSKLLLLAKRLKESNRGAAAGRCLGSSLLFASFARQKGFPVTLLRWTVLHDADYADHWAVRFNDRFAIDLTSIQFDANAEVLQEIAAYPSSFAGLREYPFEVFSAIYLPQAHEHRFTARTLWRFHNAMLAYDLRSAYRQGRLLRMAMVFVGRIKDYRPLIARGLNEWAQRRLDVLQRRRAAPDGGQKVAPRASSR